VPVFSSKGEEVGLGLKRIRHVGIAACIAAYYVSTGPASLVLLLLRLFTYLHGHQ